jgi:hypothetical protein
VLMVSFVLPQRMFVVLNVLTLKVLVQVHEEFECVVSLSPSVFCLVILGADVIVVTTCGRDILYSYSVGALAVDANRGRIAWLGALV